MFNFLASQIPGPIFCTPASLGHASVTGMSIGNLQYILLHDIHNLLCDLILKHESTSPEFVWGFQCSLLGSKIHYSGQEKSNSLHGSTQVVNIHYLGQNIYLLLLIIDTFNLNIKSTVMEMALTENFCSCYVNKMKDTFLLTCNFHHNIMEVSSVSPRVPPGQLRSGMIFLCEIPYPWGQIIV